MEQTLYKNSPSTLYFKRTLNDYLNFCRALSTSFSPDFLSLPSALGKRRDPVFLCIGTDRMTGDCLGPLVGHQLNQYYKGDIPVLGTLKHPVHALNLEETLTYIHSRFSNPYLIVIDASLGIPDHIGLVTVFSGAITPGEGMKKKLPSVGDLSITGIVNSCRGNPSLLLQNTRLHLVHELSQFICAGLISTLDF